MESRLYKNTKISDCIEKEMLVMNSSDTSVYEWIDVGPKEQEKPAEAPVKPESNVTVNGDGLDEETIRKNREKMFSMMNAKKKPSRSVITRKSLYQVLLMI